jgi:type VI secretion system protein VasD
VTGLVPLALDPVHAHAQIEGNVGMSQGRVRGRAARRGSQTVGAALLGTVFGLSGCSSPPPPPPPPTVLAVTLNAAATVNATPDGQGAPVLVRIYQLASPAAFEGAEFFRLYRQDAATLGPDLVKKDEYLLAPNQTKSVTITPMDTVHALGVFAVYRDFQSVNWRAATEVMPHATTNVVVALDATGLTLKATPEKKPGT